MSDGDELPENVTTYRVPAARLVHAPRGEMLPTQQAFALSSPERAARDRGEIVRVSVWDARKISPEDAKAQRTGAGTFMVFTLPVNVVRIIAATELHPGLRVVEDREGAPEAAPHFICDAHAGIEGLAGKESKVKMATIRAKLADACQLCVLPNDRDGAAAT